MQMEGTRFYLDMASLRRGYDQLIIYIHLNSMTTLLPAVVFSLSLITGRKRTNSLILSLGNLRGGQGPKLPSALFQPGQT